MVPPINIKRVYLPCSPDDGQRILVERLWPRGMTKAKANVDLWLKDIAPSRELRTWFGHDPARWAEFKKRYWRELKANPSVVKALIERMAGGPVTLVYAAHDEQHNSAVALKEFVEKQTWGFVRIRTKGDYRGRKMLHKMTHKELTLYPVGPFRLDLTAWTLRRRPENRIDHWDGETYSRILLLAGEPVEVCVTQTRRRGRVALAAQVRHSRRSDDTVAALPKILTKMLGLDVNLHSFYLLAENDPLLRDLVRPFVGMKPPRFPNLFEAIINGIACQQLSLVVGIGLLNKLAWNFGRGLSNESQAQHSFPDAVALLSHTANELRALGFSFAKARAVLSLARSVSDGQWNADAISRLPDGEAQKSLETLTGVGRWTAEYVLLRGLGRLHIFPADDVGARNNLQNWLGISEPLDYARTRRLLARWSGFGGLIYFNLLLKKLHDRGALQ